MIDNSHYVTRVYCRGHLGDLIVIDQADLLLVVLLEGLEQWEGIDLPVVEAKLGLGVYLERKRWGEKGSMWS